MIFLEEMNSSDLSYLLEIKKFDFGQFVKNNFQNSIAFNQTI